MNTPDEHQRSTDTVNEPHRPENGGPGEIGTEDLRPETHSNPHALVFAALRTRRTASRRGW